MNIVMMTNTYAPMVGGLEKSVESFAEDLRRRGHRVLVVTPDREDAPSAEKDVIRVPAIQNFNGTDFPVELPVSTELSKALVAFRPDLIHTHHPFLIGDTALRAAAEFNIPIVFTNHTLYEQNMHYIAGNSLAMKRFIIKLTTGFANLCDQVIAPSESVAKLLARRGVTVPIAVVPTGIEVKSFAHGKGEVFRQRFGIPPEAFVLGIVSRVAPEKNFVFLTQVAARMMLGRPEVWFVVVGDGPLLEDVKDFFVKQNLADRLVCPGFLKGRDLADTYAAFDVFVFASRSETQGLVLVEAMAAGAPVVALNAPGVREVVCDRSNGRLLPGEDVAEFVKALEEMAQLPPEQRREMSRQARETARLFARGRSVTYLLKVYRETMRGDIADRAAGESSWIKGLRVWKTQRELMKNLSVATGVAIAAGSRKAVTRVRRRFQRILREALSSR